MGFNSNYIQETEEINEILVDYNKWEIQIPVINLDAEIKEGTESEIIEYYVGHFTETVKENGNVGLAAHNRGYTKNYFENLKDLEIGDLIYYTYNGETKEYVVQENTIIKDTDWSYLQTTEENKITLITCVEDMPEYRRCVQGIENI